MPRCAIVSFRFGPTDGVSAVARTWADALVGSGFDVDWVAGAVEPGWDDPRPLRLVDGLGLHGDREPTPDPQQVADALAGADLRGAQLEGGVLDGVRYDDTTRWPEGFIPPASGGLSDHE